jgi:hypothetical protein
VCAADASRLATRVLMFAIEPATARHFSLTDGNRVDAGHERVLL